MAVFNSRFVSSTWRSGWESGAMLAYLFLMACALRYIVGLYRMQKAIEQVKSLGRRAPVVRSYLPLGLDITARAVRAARKNGALDFWRWLFDSSASQSGFHCYTAERFITPSRRIVYTADPENIKAVLATQFNDFGKGPELYKDFHEFLGDGIFAVDGQAWSQARKLIRPMFIKERVADLYILEKHVDKVLARLKSQSSGEIDVQALFFQYTLDVITEYLFGRSSGSLDRTTDDFADAFATVQRTQNTIQRAGLFKNLVSRKEMRDGLDVLNSFIQPFVHEALSLSSAEEDVLPKSTETFLQSLTRYTDDPVMIRDQLVSVLFAGRDTTAATLSWTLFELSRRPDTYAQLRSAVLAVVGNDQPPTYSDLKNLKFLTHVINETLRLYPVVPFNYRTALCNTTLPTGGGRDGTEPVGIPKGTRVAYSVLFMQRREDLYPATQSNFKPIYSPNEWEPRRWESWTPAAWQYIPFNGGPRICVGQNFAMIEIAYTIVRIVQCFDAILGTGTETIPKNDTSSYLKADIILQPGGLASMRFI